MNDSSDMALSFETLSQLAPEASRPEAHLPGLQAVLREISPLPHAALFLGVADDGLPVLLNLKDPVPGPILVSGDSGSGKTHLLHMVAQAVSATQDEDSVRFAVITEKPDEWEALNALPNCEGVLTFRQPLTTNYLTSLVSWAHSNKHDRQFVLLLIDGLEGLQADESLHQSFRWLLLRGPARRIWPIVTLKATRASAMNDWLPAFRTRLCGHIASDRDLEPLAGRTEFSFDRLAAGSHFAMREGQSWLPFWLPRAG